MGAWWEFSRKNNTKSQVLKTLVGLHWKLLFSLSLQMSQSREEHTLGALDARPCEHQVAGLGRSTPRSTALCTAWIPRARLSSPVLLPLLPSPPPLLCFPTSHCGLHPQEHPGRPHLASLETPLTGHMKRSMYLYHEMMSAPSEIQTMISRIIRSQHQRPGMAYVDLSLASNARFHFSNRW